MPNQDKYAASVVERYRVALEEGSPSHRVADEIVPLVKRWGQQYIQGISLTGAYAQYTAIMAFRACRCRGATASDSRSGDQERVLEAV